MENMGAVGVRRSWERLAQPQSAEGRGRNAEGISHRSRNRPGRLRAARSQQMAQTERHRGGSIQARQWELLSRRSSLASKRQMERREFFGRQRLEGNSIDYRRRQHAGAGGLFSCRSSPPWPGQTEQRVPYREMGLEQCCGNRRPWVRAMRSRSAAGLAEPLRQSS